ncbi:MAG: DUF397 domain-containing protein [Pseudonocardiales bacterium]|nr:DUF397 domain-containing protein [Pseudonocardiales bacterium]
MSRLHPVDLTGARWRRSSSADLGDAEPQVEIAMLDDGHVAMRTAGDDDTVLVFTPAEWDAFVLGAKDGEFDLPEGSTSP